MSCEPQKARRMGSVRTGRSRPVIFGDSAGGGGGGAVSKGNYACCTGPFTNSPASGGAGLASGISGSSTWYAAGGGGSGFYTGSRQNGIGGAWGVGIAGTANTGSGGGGGRNGAGGSGGSGVVILRHPDAYPRAKFTTGGVIVTQTGGFWIYKYTSSGTIAF